MHVGLDRADRDAEHRRRLRVRKLVDMAQHHRLAQPRRKAREPGGEGVQLRPPHRVVFRARRLRRLAAVELDEPRTDAPDAVAEDVDRDPVQPLPLLELANPLGRIRHQRAIGAQEGVLRHLLGVVPVAGEREPEREDPVLVLSHHPLEAALGRVHQSPKPGFGGSGCTGSVLPAAS